MARLILVIDAGTTFIKTSLWSKELELISESNLRIGTQRPSPDYVEQDPNEMWDQTKKSISETLGKAGISTNDVSSIGLTNQRETVVAWNRKNGKILYPAISWRDTRTSEAAERLRNESFDFFKSRTGLTPDSYFSATKMRWILDKVEDARSAAREGDLALGTVDSWILWKLSGGKVFSTDHTNASRTMLYNLSKRSWDTEITETLEIPVTSLPEIENSASLHCRTDKESAGFETPVYSVIGDQQSSLLGHGLAKRGGVKNSYGTGAFLMANTGQDRVSTDELLTTVAYSSDTGQFSYSLEGNIFMAGDVVEWLKDSVGMLSSYSDIPEITPRLIENKGLYFVNSFYGLGAPFWIRNMKGALIGLTAKTTSSDIVAAAVASIGFRTLDILKSLENAMNTKAKALNVDGGLAINNYFVQFLADILNIPVIRPDAPQSVTARGAAVLAGHVDQGTSIEDLLSLNTKNEDTVEPGISRVEADKLYEGWLRVIRMLSRESRG